MVERMLTMHEAQSNQRTVHGSNPGPRQKLHCIIISDIYTDSMGDDIYMHT